MNLMINYNFFIHNDYFNNQSFLFCKLIYKLIGNYSD